MVFKDQMENYIFYFYNKKLILEVNLQYAFSHFTPQTSWHYLGLKYTVLCSNIIYCLNKYIILLALDK